MRRLCLVRSSAGVGERPGLLLLLLEIRPKLLLPGGSTHLLLEGLRLLRHIQRRRLLQRLA